MLMGNEKTPVTWQLVNETQTVRRLVRKLEREAPGPVRVCYEAGPCGYAFAASDDDDACGVSGIAPTLIPRKPGELIKTNCDARKLVKLHRAGPADGGPAADAGRRSRSRSLSGA
jgi:hypothetical protein